MNKFCGSILLALSLASPTAEKGPKPESRFLTAETIGWFEKTLIIPENEIDDSDWSEILARFGWVLLERSLPEEARLRTNARANSMRPSRAMLFGDTAPAKRALCVVISRLNDKVLYAHTVAALEARIANLEGLLAIKKQ